MRPEANSLILRHFHIGSEILQFVAANVPGVQIPLLPRTLEDLIDNVFLQHDLNIFNFIIRLNRELRDQGIEIQPRTQFDTDGVTAGPFDIDRASLPRGRLNVLDLETRLKSIRRCISYS